MGPFAAILAQALISKLSEKKPALGAALSTALSASGGAGKATEGAAKVTEGAASAVAPAASAASAAAPTVSAAAPVAASALASPAGMSPPRMGSGQAPSFGPAMPRPQMGSGQASLQPTMPPARMGAGQAPLFGPSMPSPRMGVPISPALMQAPGFGRTFPPSGPPQAAPFPQTFPPSGSSLRVGPPQGLEGAEYGLFGGWGANPQHILNAQEAQRQGALTMDPQVREQLERMLASKSLAQDPRFMNSLNRMK